ncbi:hypothetical protein [Rhizobium sp. G21]|uniref:hypothetical protein n=1 Tax=Rhizobium sp. G21 TaxID=2758439 RepID=UPI0016020988|nr:hypothetical protein [Rhizobium sp. G21]MBB1250515.1 hypothetical protein [Rhizobium sp. G21]
MQQADHPSHTPAALERDDAADPLARLWLVCRRQFRLVATILVVSLVAWASYLALATSTYQSSAGIHILAEEPDYWRKPVGADPAATFDENLASQMELIKSGETLRRLVVDGGLLTQPDFTPRTSRVSVLMRWFNGCVRRSGETGRRIRSPKPSPCWRPG